MAEIEATELLVGVLKELKDLKEMVARNTKQLYDIQATVDFMSAKYENHAEITFPVRTHEAFDEIEEMMQDMEGREYITMQLRTILKKGDEMWLLSILDENLLEDYNLTEKGEKRGLLAFKIIDYALKYMNMEKRTISHCLKVTKDRLMKRKQRREDVQNKKLQKLTAQNETVSDDD